MSKGMRLVEMKIPLCKLREGKMLLKESVFSKKTKLKETNPGVLGKQTEVGK